MDIRSQLDRRRAISLSFFALIEHIDLYLSHMTKISEPISPGQVPKLLKNDALKMSACGRNAEREWLAQIGEGPVDHETILSKRSEFRKLLREVDSAAEAIYCDIFHNGCPKDVKTLKNALEKSKDLAQELHNDACEMAAEMSRAASDQPPITASRKRSASSSLEPPMPPKRPYFYPSSSVKLPD